MKRTLTLAFTGLVALIPSASGMLQASGQQTSHPTPAPVQAALQVPLEFEANQGQAPRQYGFVAHGPTYSLRLAPGDIALSLRRKTTGNASQIQLRLVGVSSTASFQGLDRKAGISNYFIGNDPAKWQTHVPHFGRVQMDGAYPGIDLAFYGNPQQLEYDFRVAPGADPHTIRLQADGARSTRLDRAGNLVLTTADGEVQLKHPVTYQEINGVHSDVSSRYRLLGNNTIGFAVGQYDHSRPLVIDPVLLYAVAIGGSNGNQAIGVDVDASGNAYVAGNTCSNDFPTTAGNFATISTNIQVPYCQDAFVLKLDPTASTLLYSDYIGGSVAQTAAHLAVDSSGNAYVTGGTGSTNFPLVNNIGPASPVPCGISKSGFNCSDGFIFKLSPDGSQLLFSSLLGGSQSSGGYEVKLNPVSGDVLVAGETNSADFKPTPTTLETTYSAGTCPNAIPCENAFLLGLNASTGALKYGTFFGSSGYLVLAGLATDSTGDIYVTGSTTGPPASALGTVTQTYPPAGVAAGGADTFVARLHLAGSTLSTVYMTVIQGELDEGGASIAVDSSQNAYIIGSTASLHLPVTTGAFQSANANTGGNNCLWQGPVSPLLPVACGTGYVAKLGATGTLSFLTYLGGNNQTWGQAIGVDSLGDIWLTGVTSASDFPLSSDAYKSTGITAPGQFNNYNPFLAEMTNNGSALPFASPIATSPGQSTDIKIDANNNVYVTGFGSAAPSTPNVYPANPDVYNPIFIQKWNPGPQPKLQLSSTALTFGATPYGGASTPQSVTVQNTGGGTLELQLQLATTSYNPTIPVGFEESDNCGTSLAAGASCTINVTFAPAAPSPTCLASAGCSNSSPSGIISIATNTATGSQTISLAGVAGHGSALAVTPNPIVFAPQNAGTPSSQLSVSVLSEGDLPLQIAGASITGTNAQDFQVASLGTCASAVAVGQSGCYLYLVFNPSSTATGTRTASLVLTDNAGDSPQSIPISGLVTSTGPGLLVSPTSLSIGPAIIGSTTPSSQGVLTLTNPSSDTNLQVASLTFGGANGADFAIANTLPVTIAKGSSVNILVNFLPVAGPHGIRNAALTVVTNPAVTGLPVITLSGDALNPADSTTTLISVPSPQDFGSVQVGQSSQAGNNLLSIGAKQFSSFLCGSGASTSCGGPLTITSIVPGLSDYTAVVNPFPGYCTAPPLTIPAGGACQFQLNFTPTAAGNRNTTLTINTNDPGGPAIVPLFGTGLSLPLGTLSASVLNFGPSAIGLASPPLSVTLQNIGVSNLSVSNVSATANFTVASNTCTGAPLAPNASCTIGVSFSPTSAGPVNGTLTITDNDFYSGQQTVALTGTGATGALLRINPNSINFGNQGFKTSSPQQTITIANTGSTAVTFPANAMHLTNADYTLVTNTCGSTLAIGASCNLVVQFKPTILYVDNGSLVISDNAAGSPQPLYLSGFGATIGGTPTGKLTSSLNPSATGQAVTFTATFAGSSSGAPVPTGVVQFTDSLTLLGSQTLNASGQASITTSSLAVGNHFVAAIYGGDANYGSVNSPVVTQVVNPAASNATTTTLISTFNPLSTGQALVFTATVAGVSVTTPTPTGSISFFDGPTPIGTATVNGAGQALLAVNSLSNGSHTITAVYSGDGLYTTSTSTALTEVVNVAAKVGTTTSLSSSLNPATTGQTVVFTATVAGTTTNTPTPTGSVTFLDGTTTLGAGTLNGSGQASFSISTLAVGTHAITAVYGADTNYAASTSTPLNEVINAPAKVNTTTVIVSSANPATTGQTVLFTATVAGTPTNSPVPTGTVTFMDGTSTIGTGTINGAGQAAFSTSALTVGSHTITAVYGGDTNYAGSTSTALTEMINAPAKVNTTTGLASSLNPATTGQSVVLTATVIGTPTNTPTPTGSVTFMDGTTTIGTGTLNAGGQASLTTSALALGSHTITAVYSGDTNYSGSTSTALTEVINAPAKVNTTTAVASSSNPVAAGASVVFTATVTGTTSNTPTPTGTVTFLDGSTTLGTGTLNASGIESYTTTTLAVGSHSITAQYGGDAVYAGSTSTALSESITVAPNFSLSFNPTALTIVRGQSGIVTVTETTVGGFNQPITFACSGLPAFSSCTFSPATLTPAAGSSIATSVLTIATNVGVGYNDLGNGIRPSSNRIWSAGLVISFGLLVTLRGRRRLLSSGVLSRVLMLMIFLLGGLAATQLAGCGGGSAIQQTPTGTGNVTVTATAGSAAQSASFSLTIQ